MKVRIGNIKILELYFVVSRFFRIFANVINLILTIKKKLCIISRKKDLFSYFDNKENRTEEEEKLYKALKDELKFFDTTSICRGDVREIMNDENMELSENDMIDLADALDILVNGKERGGLIMTEHNEIIY